MNNRPILAPPPCPVTATGSWLPTVPLIGAKLLELRKRRTIMIVTVAFTVVLPVVFYGTRLLIHLSDPARPGRRTPSPPRAP